MANVCDLLTTCINDEIDIAVPTGTDGGILIESAGTYIPLTVGANDDVLTVVLGTPIWQAPAVRTLDDAYNVSAGPAIINADAGEVQIVVSGGSKGLIVQGSGNGDRITIESGEGEGLNIQKAGIGRGFLLNDSGGTGELFNFRDGNQVVGRILTCTNALGNVEWQAPAVVGGSGYTELLYETDTTTATIVGGYYLIANTTTSRITLPAGPADGDTVTWQMESAAGTLELDPNGTDMRDLVGLTTQNTVELSLHRAIGDLYVAVYIAATNYWAITRTSVNSVWV